MKAFTYKAKTGPDQIVEGKIYANTVQEVVDNLHNRGWTATNVQEMHMEEQKGVVSAGVNRFLGVRLKELISFSRQLANLIKSGLPILQALSVLQDQTRDPHFKHVIGDIAENVKHGQTVSSGLREYGRVFPSFYRAMLSAGENSGAIDVALNRIADYYTKRYQLVSKIKSALAYPILILVVGALTLVFIFTNVIPRVIPLLVNLNMKLPLPTRMLIWMSDFLRNNWMWVLLWVFIFFLIFERSLKNKIFAYHFSKFKLSIPVFGDVLMKSEIAQFSRAVAMSLQSGIPVIQAINICIPIINEYAIVNDIKESLRQLEAGGSFGETLKNNKTFPIFVSSLIGVGERSGNLVESLNNIADSYEMDCEEAIETMTNLIEPVMVLAVGLVVGFIVMAVLLPILNMNVLRV